MRALYTMGMKKTLMYILGAVVAAGLAYGASVYWRLWSMGAEYRDMARSQQLWLAEEYARGAKINALEKLDTYGGKTPQETWSMFVRALEAGDTDLAAKYFVLDKQEKMKADLAMAKQNGVLKSLLEDFKTIEHEKMQESGKDFSFITRVDPEFNLPSVYSLHYSTNSNLWKIYEL